MIDKEKIFEKTKEYFNSTSEKIKSASGLIEYLMIDGLIEVNTDLLLNDNIYPFVKSKLLIQGIGIPKHAHESIMKDFDDVFGGKRESSTILIKTIKNVGINIDEFKKETDNIDKKDIVVENINKEEG